MIKSRHAEQYTPLVAGSGEGAAAPVIQGGEDQDPIAAERRDYVKKVTAAHFRAFEYKMSYF